MLAILAKLEIKQGSLKYINEKNKQINSNNKNKKTETSRYSFGDWCHKY